MALLGDPEVGRTSLCLAAIHKIWTTNPQFISSRSYLPEVDEFGGRVWNTTLYEEINEELYSFHTEVHEPSQNKASIGRALRNCDIAILAFDLTNRDSFHNINSTWASLLTSVPTLLVGLKAGQSLEVEHDEALAMVTTHKFLKYTELSVRQDRSVDIFQDALLVILSDQQSQKEVCSIM